jgi:hypothetical protein
MSNRQSFIRIVLFVIGVAALAGFGQAGAAAQASHDHPSAPAAEASRAQEKAGALIKTVREATERFQDVEAAKAEGYALQFGCVSGSESGAMACESPSCAMAPVGQA